MDLRNRPPPPHPTPQRPSGSGSRSPVDPWKKHRRCHPTALCGPQLPHFSAQTRRLVPCHSQVVSIQFQHHFCRSLEL
ncbi:hypothetical protein ACS0TY_024948 [Phlomoides rotata]